MIINSHHHLINSNHQRHRQNPHNHHNHHHCQMWLGSTCLSSSISRMFRRDMEMLTSKGPPKEEYDEFDQYDDDDEYGGCLWWWSCWCWFWCWYWYGYDYGHDGEGDMIWKIDDELSALFCVIGAKEQCSQCQYQSTLSPISYILNMARLCTKS